MRLNVWRERWRNRFGWLITAAPFGFTSMMCVAGNQNYKYFSYKLLWFVLVKFFISLMVLAFINSKSKEIYNRSLKEPPEPLNLGKYLWWVFVFVTPSAIYVSIALYLSDLWIFHSGVELLPMLTANGICLIFNGIIVTLWSWHNNPTFSHNHRKNDTNSKSFS